jgi:hypothetical protein
MEPMGRSSRSKRANGFVGPKNSKVVEELESIEDRTGVLEIILVQNVSTGSEVSRFSNPQNVIFTSQGGWDVAAL